MLDVSKISDILGEEAESLLGFSAPKISKCALHVPGSDWVERIFAHSNRNSQVLRSLQAIFGSGRLANTGYLSILPVDQGIEHSAGASFALNTAFFDPDNVCKLAIEGSCNAVATTFGNLSMLSRKYAHKIPFIVKFNHNELLSYPNTFDQTIFCTVKQAHELGAVAVGATIYFGSSESTRQITEVSKAFAVAHDMGMATVLWCYLRNNAFKMDGVDYHNSADLTGQANHIGATIGADIVKQKLPECNGGYTALQKKYGSFGKSHEKMYTELCSDHPIDLTRYQVMNSYMGRVALINSGGPSGKNDLQQALRTAVINKRAGGAGLISGRKSFQKSFKEGIELLQAIQDVYLCKEITVV